MSSLRAAKKELRQKIKRVLVEVTAENARIQSSSAVRPLLALPQYRAAQRLSVYLSMPTGEISTTEIVRDAMNAGKQVFVPYTYQASTKVEGQPSSIMDMVELKSFEDFQGFKADKWAIPTPSEDSIAARRNSFGGTGKSEAQCAQTSRGAGLDLIVMPGMAFDRNMGRLGHGKGYYDYFLGRCHSQSAQGQTKMPFLVGLALNEQLLPEGEYVPSDDTDWKLDALVLGDGSVLRPEER